MQKGVRAMERKEAASNHEPNVQFISSIRGLYFSLKFLGAWPQTNSSIRDNLVWYIQLIGLLFVLFGPIAGLVVHRNNAEKVIADMMMTISLTAIFIKWIAFSVQKNTFNTILVSMQTDWTNLEKNASIIQSVPESKRIMAMCCRNAKIYFLLSITLTVFGTCYFVVDSGAVKNSDSNETNFDTILPLPYSWYPLDFNRSLNIQLLATTQTITFMTISLTNVVVDSFFVAVTLHLCGQLQILRCFIEGITYDFLRPEHCKAKVRLMVKRHQVLLGLGQRIQDFYNLLVLVQFTACTLVLCFTGYALLAELESGSPNMKVIMKTGSHCLATLQVIFAYCFTGDYLTNESLAIPVAVYNAEWYNCYTRSINLTFLIVMIRAQKPVEITGAKLFLMSLGNFTVLMKAAMSYLSVLRAMGVGKYVEKD